MLNRRVSDSELTIIFRGFAVPRICLLLNDRIDHCGVQVMLQLLHLGSRELLKQERKPGGREDFVYRRCPQRDRALP